MDMAVVVLVRKDRRPRRALVAGAVQNAGPDRDMTGWYLFSDKGNELFAFPEGCLFPSGGTLTVGTLSSREGSFDLLWNDKKVINQKKADGITLYDRYGRAVDRRGNGL